MSRKASIGGSQDTSSISPEVSVATLVKTGDQQNWDEPKSVKVRKESFPTIFPAGSIKKDGWLNRFFSPGSAFSNLASPGGTNTWSNTSNQQHWRLVRAIVHDDGTLKLYKPPSDLGVKAFDLEAPHQALPAFKGTDLQVNFEALSSKNYHSPNYSNLPRPSQQFPPSGSRLFFHGKEGHPELEHNDKGKIVGGSVEAICHTILVGPSDSFAKTSILLLPLFTDIVSAIELFTLYSTGIYHFGTNGAGSAFSSSNHKLTPGSSTLPTTDSSTTILPRLTLIVETLQEKFPGMLLDQKIFSVFMRFVESISYYDDTVATDLKMSVFMKQKYMTEMLSYDTHQEPIMWNSYRPHLNEIASDRLHFVLNQLDNVNSTKNLPTSNKGIHSHNYTSVNNPTLLHPANAQLPGALPPDLVLEVSVDTFAKQIYYFHLSFSKDWSPTSDISLLFSTKYSYTRHSPLVFDSTSNHFLGALLIDHLLNKIHRIDNAYRGKVLTYWINLGNALKNCGDMVGWLSIATVICSLPVLRLRGTWCYVSTEIRDRVIREWAPVVFDLERRLMVSGMSRKSTYHVLAPQGIGMTYPKERVVPYFGDLCVKYQEGSTYKQCEARLNSIQTAFERWEAYLEQIPQNDTFEPLPEPIPVIQRMLYALLSNHFNSSALSLELMLRMSLEVEPNLSGIFVNSHYKQQVPLSAGTYFPLFFTKVGSAYSMFPSPTLVAASGTLPGNPKRTIRQSTSRTGESFRPSTSLIQQSTTFSTLSGNTLTSSGHTTKLNRSLPSISLDDNLAVTGYYEVDSSSRAFFKNYGTEQSLSRTFRDIFCIGAKMYYIRDEIILKSYDEDKVPSLESELGHSNQTRVTRRLSAQISDSPHVLEDNIHMDDDLSKWLNVVVKAATLDRLVDILVLGVEEFGCFVFSSERNTNSTFRLDMDLHTLTFFATFRSFCSPSMLLESMRKRFTGARSAAVSIKELHETLSHQSAQDKASGDMTFPNWDPQCDVDPAAIDWRLVAQIQIGVLEACHLWVSQYFSDFSSDLVNRDQFLNLLKTFELELQSWKEAGILSRAEYKIYYDTIEALHRKVRKLFIKKSYRPIDVKRLVPTFPLGTKSENLLQNGDISKLELFVDQIDLFAAEYFNMLQVKDWMEVFEILEAQNTESSGFYNFRFPYTTGDDELVVQDIYNYIEALYREGSEDRILSLLPRPMRELFRLHANLVNFFTVQISDPTIKREVRIGRMATLLKLLGIIRHRMSSLSIACSSNEPPQHEDSSAISCIPSFLETSITAAILRPESRAFTYSWNAASSDISKQFGGSFSGSVQTLESIIPVIPLSQLKAMTKSFTLTPCVGWIIERLLEIVCYIPNMAFVNTSLINFDKRRMIYNMAVNISDMRQHTQGLDSLYASGLSSNAVYEFTKKKAYLINPVKGLHRLDRRLARDAANRELKEYPKSSAKLKIFMPYVSAESEKSRRDARQRDIMERQAKELRKGTSKSKLASIAPSDTPALTPERKGKSRFGGLLKAVRPISMAFSNSFTPPTEKVLHPDDLPEFSSLGDARFKLVSTRSLDKIAVVSLKSNLKDSMFKITCDGDSEMVLQAPSHADAEEWVQVLTLASKQAAMLAVSAPTSTKVFGVPINIMCEREGTSVPRVVDILLNEIEARGLDDVGLYRIPGSLASVNALKNAFDSGENVDMKDDRWFDINAATGCFKLYLRELPEPLLTSELFGEFIICATMDSGCDGVELLRRCIHRLPEVNYNLLKRIVNHLVLVTEHGKSNLMHAVNLAIVFSMSFLPVNSSPTSVSSDLGAMQALLKTMIQSRDDLFSEKREDDSEALLPSQLPVVVPAHHLGVTPGEDLQPLEPTQAPHSFVESESEGSVLSLEISTTKKAESGTLDSTEKEPSLPSKSLERQKPSQSETEPKTSVAHNSVEGLQDS